MREACAVLAAMLASLGAARASAGETRCWVENGAVVVPAVLGDISGDFILDLSAPVSQLHNTAAELDGIDDAVPAKSAPFTLAGETAPATFQVADLDARSWDFPTTIDGVIGWDVLSAYVVRLQFDPCRLTLEERPGGPPQGTALPLAIVGGAPSIAASVSDGRTAMAGRMAIDTASAGVRLSDGVAALGRPAPKGLDVTSRSAPPARIDALAFGQIVLRRTPASLQPQTPPGLIGSLGLAAWAPYALTINARRGVVELSAPMP
jgi:hypothetical protein